MTISLQQFSKILMASSRAIRPAMEAVVDAHAQKVEAAAKAEIGTYQPAVGEFPAWASLAEGTKADRVYKGFSEDDPLLRTGELRESISRQSNGLTAVVGSTSPIMAYQEFGTPSIPPRPVIGPAAESNQKLLEKAIDSALGKIFKGG